MSDTIIQLKLSLPAYRALKEAAAQYNTTEAELAAEVIQDYLKNLKLLDPVFGLFADEPELIDDVLEDAMRSRETRPLRLSEAGSESKSA